MAIGLGSLLLSLVRTRSIILQLPVIRKLVQKYWNPRAYATPFGFLPQRILANDQK